MLIDDQGVFLFRINTLFLRIQNPYKTMEALSTIVWIFLLKQLTFQTAVSSICCTERSLNGYILRGNVYKRYSKKSFESCVFLCQSETRCASINYRRDKKCCELNKFRTEKSPGWVIAQKNSIFMKNVLQTYGCTFECRNGGFYVMDVTGLDGFCSCRSGYSGFACESKL